MPPRLDSWFGSPLQAFVGYAFCLPTLILKRLGMRISARNEQERSCARHNASHVLGPPSLQVQREPREGLCAELSLGEA